MEKVFLYLYPIKEFFSPFIHENDNFLAILNETIDKRYRQKGYKIVYVVYPDKEMYGLDKFPCDEVIQTDITFSTHIGENSLGNHQYPSEKLLLKSFYGVSELIIGGFHYNDCVKRVGEVALNIGINCLVDLDLTDLFFNLCNTNYFDINFYDPEKFKEYMILKKSRYGYELSTRIFERNYSSQAYGMHFDSSKIIK